MPRVGGDLEKLSESIKQGLKLGSNKSAVGSKDTILGHLSTKVKAKSTSMVGKSVQETDSLSNSHIKELEEGEATNQKTDKPKERGVLRKPPGTVQGLIRHCHDGENQMAKGKQK